MLCLVTGGSGFLGAHLVRRLLADGHRVRVLGRTVPADATGQTNAEWRRGDVTDPATLPAPLEGVERLFHVAGKVDFDPRRPDELLRVNVDGVRNLYEAARRAAVGKVVHVSSVSTLGAAASFEEPRNETHFGSGPGTELPYPQSKLRGEKVALEFAAAGLPLVVCNPTFIGGPGDIHLTSARTVVSFLQGQVWVGLDRGGMGYTDVRDVAAGLALAMDRGRPGERYVIGGHNLRLSDYHRLLSELSGRRPPRLHVPPRVATVLAAIGPTFYRLQGRQSYVSAGDVQFGKNYWVYNYAKIRTELGLNCRHPRQSLADAMIWLADAGYWRPTAERRALLVREGSAGG